MCAGQLPAIKCPTMKKGKKEMSSLEVLYSVTGESNQVRI